MTKNYPMIYSSIKQEKGDGSHCITWDCIKVLIKWLIHFLGQWVEPRKEFVEYLPINLIECIDTVEWPESIRYRH